ncbi:hypothetical protein J437_LFUL003099 [Ladona fulva]|uniref:Uncharacterized protein n=1 Tax=Ladona fulva TaxID=123851 RepID=A0A8K0JZD5_LADFU|nr:hypothetical protein J437_LFUL003099 [Ladona fulva]
MDYNSMKKLASVMGEEFKVIDSLTLENINLQRLITKEKEYCANLETLLKKKDEEIESVENETRRFKSKLEEVTNRGLLLKTSLESLKSSHKMVDLLKVDLQKQLHLEEVKTSEQNMKFDSTIKKLMEESLKIVKDDEKRGQPLGILNSDIKKELHSKPHSFIMASLEESNKENIYLPPDAKTCSSSKTSYVRYEAILAKRIQSVPLLKLPPLPLLDSPPRKVRSVGNLLSPPKTEWSKEDIDDLTVKHAYGTDVKQWNASAPDISSHEQNSLKTEKELVQNNVVSGAQNLNSRISSNLEIAENDVVSNDFQQKSIQEKEYEIKIQEMEVDSKGKEIETMEVDEESGSNGETAKVEHLPKQSDELKALPSLDSVEFSYEPRTELKCPKVVETATEEMKSPYFVSSYLNFLEIPKNVEESTEKANNHEKNTQSFDLDKNETMVIDLTDERDEVECERQDVHAVDEKVSEVSHIRQKKQNSAQPLERDVDDNNASHNNTYIIHDVEAKPYEGTDDEGALNHDSSMYHSASNGDQSYQFDIETQMECSQISSMGSAEYAETSYASMSPGPSRVQSPFPSSPNINNQAHVNIFESPPGLQSFNCNFSNLQQSSASALFGDPRPKDGEGKDRKQTEVFNFAFDTKRNTSTMFKLF